MRADARGQKSCGLKRTLACGRLWKAEVLPLLSWSAQMLRSPGMCDAITDHLRLWAQAATSCTKTCKGQAVVNSLLTPASEAVLSCDVALGFFGEARPLLLDFLELPSFCEPRNGAAGDEPTPYLPTTLPSAQASAAALHASIGLLLSGHARLSGSIAATILRHVGQASVLCGCVRDAHPGGFVTRHNARQVSWHASACPLELENF